MFRTSKLTQQESCSFKAALYRFWLFSQIYGIKHALDDFDEEEEEDQDQDQDQDVEDDDDVFSVAVQKKRYDFLQNFSAQELAELEKIVHFLEDTAGWALRSDWEELRGHQGDLGPSKVLHSLIRVLTWSTLVAGQPVDPQTNQHCRVLALLGPDATLKAYQAGSVNAAYASRNPWLGETDLFFSAPLTRIQEERSNLQQQDSTSSTNSKVIINHVVGVDDRCTRCDAKKGVDLWNETSNQPSYSHPYLSHQSFQTGTS